VKNSDEGVIVALCVSQKKHTPKQKVDAVFLKENWGILGDAHAGSKDREVSFLTQESIARIKTRGVNPAYGGFGENLVTEGIDLLALPVGQRLMLGDSAVVEITKFGKTCHTPCAIYHTAGFCVMPEEGIFARVISPGSVKTLDKIKVIG
jgi:MOSC domain-containing protein YiiM